MGKYTQLNVPNIYNGAINKEKVQNLIDWYVSFYTKIHPSNKWKVVLKSLLSKFEHNLLQENSSIKKNALMKVLIKSCFYYPVPVVKEAKEDAIIFWPFQFIHCDFMELVVNALKKGNYSYQVFVFRSDLLKYLSEKSIESTLVKLIYKRYSFKYICLNIIDTIRLLFCLWSRGNTIITRNIVLNTLLFSGIVESALAAVKKVAKANSNQYHVIGYDLSVIGRALIHELNGLNIANGRIQNGAPNYLLAGYSEVQNIFLWDEISRKAYLSAGFKGNTWVVGNILLQEKLKNSSREFLFNALEGTEYKGRVLVALSGPGHNTSVSGHQATITLLRMFILQNPDFQFLLKLHPKDQKQYYRDIEGERNVIFVDNLFQRNLPNAVEFLNISDYLVTGASSVALDAFAMNVKVIALDPMYELSHFDFIYKNEAVQRVHKEDDFLQLQDLVTSDSNKGAFKDARGVEMIVNYIVKK
ncbi:MAG: hypothetical protein KF852_01750 [Saprospiraceae bacterium]|nr:hypothetical protein [Saprospiraceae bacterium]